MSLLYDSQSKREHKLTNNLLIEDANNINWIGIDFKILSCRKGSGFSSKPSDFALRKIGSEAGQSFRVLTSMVICFGLAIIKEISSKLIITMAMLVK